MFPQATARFRFVLVPRRLYPDETTDQLASGSIESIC